ncbi:alpha/beta hydrolase [Spongisporangium articulatum]|uniref:Alpha/beta hydrolase n=1 Tax=Spongisporangium articulatum TaxID=3362603 RepID=A0ABW8AHV8_9ACTN
MKRIGRLGRPVARFSVLVALVAGTTVAAASAQAATGVGTRADDGAEIVGESWSADGRQVVVQVRSPAMGETLPVKLILPRGWSFAAARTWPVMMMLQGGGGDTYDTWSRKTDIDTLATAWQVITVFPEAGPHGLYTDYYNKGAFGKPAWETFHTQEVLQLVERAYRANTTRAVAGLSSGGYGAAAYATRNPGMFRYMASYSGLVAIRMPLVRWFVYFSSGDADPSARFGVPFRDERNWEQHDPLYLAANLRGTGVFLSSGYTGLPSPADTVGWTPIQAVEPASAANTSALVLKLRALGIPVTTDFYPLGEHDWVSWQRELHRSWPVMMQAIGATPDAN